MKTELEQLIIKFAQQMKDIEATTESGHLIRHSLKKSERLAKYKWQHYLTLRNAAQALYAQLPLPTPTTLETFNPKVAKDLVITSKPAPGTQVKKDQVVTLLVSKGIEQIQLSSFEFSLFNLGFSSQA